jgi:hypothetical protein
VGERPPERDALSLAARYLESVVEGLNLCPYAAPARRAGAVRLERIVSAQDAQCCALCVAALARDAAIEAILIGVRPGGARVRNVSPGFPGGTSRERRARILFGGVPSADRVTRAAHDAGQPRASHPPRPGAHDPVPARLHHGCRARAQAGARERLAAEMPPGGWALADPVLSREIAQANFERYGEGDGRRVLEERLDALRTSPDDGGTR